jgi:hypothetical protein
MWRCLRCWYKIIALTIALAFIRILAYCTFPLTGRNVPHRGTGQTLSAKTTISVCRLVDLNAERFVRMKRALLAVVPDGVKAVMIQYLQNGQPRFDFRQLHVCFFCL